MEYLNLIGKRAKETSCLTRNMPTVEKNNILHACSKALLDNIGDILKENYKDVDEAEKSGVKSAYVDRLLLNEDRVTGMADGLEALAALNDPVNEIISMRTLENGLVVGQKRVPIGVIGMIYESRPNVTADAFGICLKAGNTIILRGGKEALLSNKAIVTVFQDAISKLGYDKNIVQFIDDPSREVVTEFMRLRDYVDVLIPRGGGSLIKSVVENSTIPVIETGIGNCHFFVDETANLDNAIEMIVKAKVQRPGVCNACEKVIIHTSIADKFLPVLCGEFNRLNVEIRGDENVVEKIPFAKAATEDDWYTEYLDYIVGIKIVNNIDEAIRHIQKYSSGHSEAILTESYTNSQKFLNEIDSAAVYVNASTRFTDGFEFGLGAEIGISTQKLHARGPMGLKELTTVKYIVYGNGQIRK